MTEARSAEGKGSEIWPGNLKFWGFHWTARCKSIGWQRSSLFYTLEHLISAGKGCEFDLGFLRANKKPMVATKRRVILRGRGASFTALLQNPPLECLPAQIPGDFTLFLIMLSTIILIKENITFLWMVVKGGTVNQFCAFVFHSFIYSRDCSQLCAKQRSRLWGYGNKQRPIPFWSL